MIALEALHGETKSLGLKVTILSRFLMIGVVFGCFQSSGTLFFVVMTDYRYRRAVSVLVTLLH